MDFDENYLDELLKSIEPIVGPSEDAAEENGGNDAGPDMPEEELDSDVAEPMEAEPDDITVLAYTVWLTTPQGGTADTGASVTLKTMLPLPVLDNSTGTPVLAQVKDCAVVYPSEDGTLHFYNAEVKIEDGAVTGISFRAPEAAVYFICFVLK